MNSILVKLESLNVSPKDKEIYFRAFTHSTLANESKDIKSYEALEFLGDSVLSKVVAEYIYLNHFSTEGKMSLLKIEAVKGTTLAEFSLKEGFDRLIKVGNTKEKINMNRKVLEDVFEAFIAALYLDQGEETVKKFLSRNVLKHIDNIKTQNLKNPKTILQEFLQGENRGSVTYDSKQVGNNFESVVIWQNQILGKGLGSTKKTAEVSAAESALEKVGKE